MVEPSSSVATAENDVVGHGETAMMMAAVDTVRVDNDVEKKQQPPQLQSSTQQEPIRMMMMMRRMMLNDGDGGNDDSMLVAPIASRQSDTSEEEVDDDDDDDGDDYDASEYRQLTTSSSSSNNNHHHQNSGNQQLQQNRLNYRTGTNAGLSTLFGIKKALSCSRLTVTETANINGVGTGNRSVEHLSTTTPTPTTTATCAGGERQDPTLPLQPEQQQPLLLAPVPMSLSRNSIHSVTLSQTSNESSLLDYPANTPICKFCHQRAKLPHNPLISPCHCKGSIRYMHARCLMKWLDKLKRRNSRSQQLCCEICNYKYRWRKKFKPPTEWSMPPCVGNDRRWHLLFVICAFLVVASVVNLVIFGDNNDDGSGGGGGRHHRHHSHNHGRGRHHRTNQSTTAAAAAANATYSEQISSYSSSGADDDTPLVAILRNISFNATKLFEATNRQQHLVSSSPAPSPSAATTNGANPFHLSTTEPWRRRRTHSTEPHEVIMIISGCLFFISFFLGTFAQIKSEISFYNMLLRFIWWNQRWIIEEYKETTPPPETPPPPPSTQPPATTMDPNSVVVDLSPAESCSLPTAAAGTAVAAATAATSSSISSISMASIVTLPPSA